MEPRSFKSRVVRTGIAVSVLILPFTRSLPAQVTTTGVPFLLIPGAVESHALGRISTLPLGDALSTRANPSLVPLQAFDVLAQGGFYLPATDWLPGFGIKTTYSAQGAQLAIPLSDEDRPEWTLGIGFARTYLDLGEFTQTLNDPGATSTFHGWEESQALSCGIAYGGSVMISAGVAITLVRSNLAPFGAAVGSPIAPGRVNTWTAGTTVQIPLTRWLGLEPDLGGVTPHAEITTALVLSDLGSSIMYVDQVQSDPLPRALTVGLSALAGVRGDFFGTNVEYLEVELLREAQDILVERSSLAGQWRYQSLPGDLSLTADLFRQSGNTRVEHRKGFRAAFAESFTVSEGSFVDAGFDRITTSGLRFSTRAIFLILRSFMSDDGFLPWVLGHVSVDYAQASYDAPLGHPLDGTDFQSFTITLHAADLHASL